jgi:glycosyltransferase involved in cell wall biosynthesis
MINFENENIFVGIPAYNERYILHTVEDLYAKAEFPENIYVGIFNQKSPEFKFEDFSKYKNVKVINASYEYPLGVGYARLSAAKLFSGQKYFLQIDAHTVFSPNWDTLLIGYHSMLSTIVSKPMISQCAAAMPASLYQDPDIYEKFRSRFVPRKSEPLTLNYKLDTQPDFSRENEKRVLDIFLEHYCSMGGYMFTSGNFISEVSYLPNLIYVFDQELTAFRSVTRGYRIFSADFVPVASMGKNMTDGFDEEKYPKDLRFIEHTEEFQQEKSWKRYQEPHEFYEYFLGIKFGFFGAPDKRSYDEFVNRSGVDYRRLTNNGASLQYLADDIALWDQ